MQYTDKALAALEQANSKASQEEQKSVAKQETKPEAIKTEATQASAPQAQAENKPAPTGPRTDGVEGVDYEIKRGGRSTYRSYFSEEDKRKKSYHAPTMEWQNNKLMEHSSADARVAYGLEHSDLDAAPPAPVSAPVPEPPKLAPVNTLMNKMAYNAFNSTEEPKSSKPSPKAQQSAPHRADQSRLNSSQPATSTPGGSGLDPRVFELLPYLLGRFSRRLGLRGH